jgi:FkbM family methyltransferase
VTRKPARTTRGEAKPFASPRVTASGGPLPFMTSFAQNLEDVMLRRALQDISGGFYIDVGAFDPVDDSVTKWFYDARWRGINVEPNPEMWVKFVDQRPDDINLQIAIGDSEGRGALHVLEGAGLSTLAPEPSESPFFQLRHVVEVRIATLDALIAEHAAGVTIDFLKIDAEGLEGAIIRGARLDRNRPRIIVVEATRPGSQEPAWEDWDGEIVSNGFLFAYFDGLNRYYVRQEDKWRLRYFDLPPCCFDSYLRYTAPVVTGKRPTSARLAEADTARDAAQARIVEIEAVNRDLETALTASKDSIATLVAAVDFQSTRADEGERQLAFLSRATDDLKESLEAAQSLHQRTSTELIETRARLDDIHSRYLASEQRHQQLVDAYDVQSLRLTEALERLDTTHAQHVATERQYHTLAELQNEQSELLADTLQRLETTHSRHVLAAQQNRDLTSAYDEQAQLLADTRQRLDELHSQQLLGEQQNRTLSDSYNEQARSLAVTLERLEATHSQHMLAEQQNRALSDSYNEQARLLADTLDRLETTHSQHMSAEQKIQEAAMAYEDQTHRLAALSERLDALYAQYEVATQRNRQMEDFYHRHIAEIASAETGLRLMAGAIGAMATIIDTLHHENLDERRRADAMETRLVRIFGRAI